MSLYLPTMILMTVAASVTMAAAIGAVRQEAHGDGLGLWAGALLAQALCYVLFALRGQVPDAFSIVLANTLLSAAFALILAAVLQFLGRALRWWRALLLPLVTAVLFVVFLDDYAARLVLSSTLFSVPLGLALWALWHPPHPLTGRGATLVVMGLALQLFILALRAVLALGGWMSEPFLAPSFIQLLSFFTAFITIILSSLGFIFMSKDRADADNRHLAAHDGLTGLANRRSLILALDRDVARAVRTREPYALMMLDIDHFKTVNDSHGHLAGDRVLCHVANLLRARLRAQDMVGRYGGEEFLALLPDTPMRGAMELAESLRQAVAQTPCMYGGEALAVTVSIGVFGGRLDPADSWDMLIHAADQALYAAKAAGRNRVECAAVLRDNPETNPVPQP